MRKVSTQFSSSSSLSPGSSVAFLFAKTKAPRATHAPFAQSAAILYLVTTSGCERTKQNHVTSRQSRVLLHHHHEAKRTVEKPIRNQSETNPPKTIARSRRNTHVFAGKLRLIDLGFIVRGRVIAIAVDRHVSPSARLVRRRVGLCPSALVSADEDDGRVGTSYVYTV